MLLLLLLLVYTLVCWLRRKHCPALALAAATLDVIPPVVVPDCSLV